MNKIVALISGLLFGTGLMVSGMTDTKKVQGWLDILVIGTQLWLLLWVER